MKNLILVIALSLFTFYSNAQRLEIGQTSKTISKLATAIYLLSPDSDFFDKMVLSIKINKYHVNTYSY